MKPMLKSKSSNLGNTI